MTRLMEVIVSDTRHGFLDDDVPVHKHQQLFTTDGKLIVELCDCNECETMEPPSNVRLAE